MTLMIAPNSKALAESKNFISKIRRNESNLWIIFCVIWKQRVAFKKRVKKTFLGHFPTICKKTFENMVLHFNSCEKNYLISFKAWSRNSQSRTLSNGTLVITCPLDNLDLCGTNLTVTHDNIELTTFLQYEGATFIKLGRNRLSYGTSAPGMRKNIFQI